MSDLSLIFNRFVGKEVPLVAEKSGRKTIERLKLKNDEDPVLAEMKETAVRHRLELRVCWPDSMGTTDFRTDRVNTHIEEAPDGKWRISNRFNIG